MLKALAGADGRTATNWLEHLIRTEYEKMKKRRGDTEDAPHPPVCAPEWRMRMRGVVGIYASFDDSFICFNSGNRTSV